MCCFFSSSSFSSFQGKEIEDKLFFIVQSIFLFLFSYFCFVVGLVKHESHQGIRSTASWPTAGYP